MEGHFAYQSGYLTCGTCGLSMAPYYTTTDVPYVYRVYCANNRCPHHLEVFEPSDKIKVRLIPTNLTAPDPNVIQAGNMNQRVMATEVVGLGTGGALNEAVVTNARPR